MSFADLKKMTDLNQSDIARLTQICFKDCQTVGEHLFYQGRDERKYAQTSFKLRDKTFRMRKMQLSLFLKLQGEGYNMNNWDETLITSHLCHSKSCLKQEHLNLESIELNKERDECNRLRHCPGHGNQPNCLV